MIPALDAYFAKYDLEWLSALVNILLVFVLARVLTRLASRLARRMAKGRLSRYGQDDTAARRLETGLSIFEGLAKYVFYFIAAAIAVGELGLTSTMTSMLAAAGIGSLALGIGAQSLIRDIAAGFFILFEGILSVGDYVLVAGVEGIVEDVSLRTVTVRGFRGEKNVIPNGAISTITNYSRDDYLAVIELAVAQEADADRALDILYEEALAVYEKMKGEGVQKPERVGITQVAESSVTLRVTMKASAMQQWAISRETIRRARLRYKEAGIRTPHNTVLLREEGK
ncbi:MAG: mechanosensitive ion channel family protein [Candidatus Pelethousia sp.]|nr:mechanosensitive ion channel family protein [Candidatus Pelethousia sp.]